MYYYRDNRRVSITEATSCRVVPVTDERDVALGEQRIRLARNLAIAPLDDRLGESLVERRVGASSMGTIVESLLASHLEQQGERGDALARAGSAPAGFPVVVTEDQRGLLFCSGEVVAEVGSARAKGTLARFLQRRPWRIDRSIDLPGDVCVLAPTEPTASPIDLANALVEEGLARYSHPVFFEYLQDRLGGSAFPHAELLPQQWHLHGGSGDAGVRASEAWRHTHGHPDVVVAVIDSGVSLAHPVFAGVPIVSPYDFEEADEQPYPSSSSHGTACAALVCGGLRSGEVVGVAPRCSLMPIRRSSVSNHLSIAAALKWAADHGADILSCSFGVDGRPWVLPDVVRSALAYCRDHGRRGKGCSIFWAAGNGGEPIDSDEWASSPDTIAIAAITDAVEKAYYSDFGAAVDLCAPSSGGRRGILTADNFGHNYDFGGTSAAAPIAAGVAALVLSVAPSMSHRDVRELLARSAKKIGPGASYTASGHSDAFGHGCVDAVEALAGIDAVSEVLARVGLGDRRDRFDSLVAAVQAQPSGARVIAATRGLRLRILALARDDVGFGRALDTVTTSLVAAAASLDDPALSLPDDFWTAIATVLRTLVPQSSPSLDQTERSVASKSSPPEETTMNNNANAIESALGRIANMLEGSAEVRSTMPPPVNPPPPPTDLTERAEVSTTRLQSMAATARQHMYLQGMPIFDRARVRTLEEVDVPRVVELLKSLKTKPTLRRDLKEALVRERAKMGDLDKHRERADAMIKALRADMGAGEERLDPITAGLVIGYVALCIAGFMASYTVAHEWDR